MSTPKPWIGGFILSFLLGLSPDNVQGVELLDHWVNRGTTELKSVDDVAHGNGLFVSAGAQVLNSADGVNWWITDPGLRMHKIAFGNGVFAGIDLSSKRIATSGDGTNWVSRVLGSPVAVYGFGYGGGLFLLSGAAGSYWTSADAINWIKRESLTNQNLGPISFANGRYFLGGYNESFSFTSTDANSWQPIQPPRILRSVAYGGGNYVACANTGILVSKNGVDWKDADYSGVALQDVIYASGYFVACGVGPSIWTSRDGTNWISRPVPAPASFALTGIVTDERTIVAGGAYTSGYLIHSGEIPGAGGDPTTAIALYPGITITGSAGHIYRIEASSDLETGEWTETARLKLPYSPYTWFDAAGPGHPMRFYRAIWEQ